MAFKQAVKINARARVALVGVPGGGKSYTMLKLARLLAGPDGKIACIDTEHGSLSKYAPPPGVAADQKNYFDFDVDEASSYSIDYFLAQLDFAEENGYAVFCADSLSHFWFGKDGALEFVDAMKKKSRDQMQGWNDFRPHERRMVDRMIASPCHIIVTMRTKNAYEVHEENGKTKRVKVGLAPVQRDGLEYEFDFVGTLDETNTLVVDKTRCPWYREQAQNGVCEKPGYAYFKPLVEWLGTGADRPVAPTPTPAPPPAAKQSSGKDASAAGNTTPAERPQPPSGVAKSPEQAIPPVAAASAPQNRGAAERQSGGSTTNGAKPVPAEVLRLWSRMTNPKTNGEVFEELRQEVWKVLGQEKSAAEIARIKEAYGDPTNPNFAKRFALEMWTSIHKLKSEMITNDDLPEILRGDDREPGHEDLLFANASSEYPG